MTGITCREAVELISRENEFPAINAENVEWYFEEHAVLFDDTVRAYTAKLSLDDCFAIWKSSDDTLDWADAISPSGAVSLDKRETMEGFAHRVIYLTLKAVLLERAGFADAAV